MLAVHFHLTIITTMNLNQTILTIQWRPFVYTFSMDAVTLHAQNASFWVAQKPYICQSFPSQYCEQIGSPGRTREVPKRNKVR